MNRIFAVLAIVSLMLMGTNIVLGLSLSGAAGMPDPVSQSKTSTHMLLGLVTSLAVVLVHSIGVTYFVGTNRWSKEVVETYGIDKQVLLVSSHLKHRAFFWSVIGMLMVVSIIALGARSDPGTGLRNTSDWQVYHFMGACCGIGLIGMTYFMVWSKIRENQQVIESILAQVKKIRKEKGLDQESASDAQKSSKDA